VNAYYEARGVPMPTDPLELKIRETETLLNVVLPDDYKTMLLSGTLPNGLKLQDSIYWTNRNIYEEAWKGYPVYNPLGLTQIGLENRGGSPELIRAVVVAKDYSDSSLVFILRDDSDVELDPHLVMVREHSVLRTKVTMTTAQQKTGFIYCHEWPDNHHDWNDDLSQSESTDKEKLLERCTRILNTQDLVNVYYASRGVLMPTDPLELKIRQSEALLNVVLPEDYKKMLLTGTLPIGFQNGNDIYWMGRDIHNEHEHIQFYLPVKNPLGLYQIGTEWTEDAPELVRAIIIGDDGIGNSLIFMLRQDSDVELDSEIVILDHDPYLVARTGVTTTVARQKAILIAQVTHF
jgi:hypothetical protein